MFLIVCILAEFAGRLLGLFFFGVLFSTALWLWKYMRIHIRRHILPYAFLGCYIKMCVYFVSDAFRFIQFPSASYPYHRGLCQSEMADVAGYSKLEYSMYLFVL